jgi:hypothetical protein
MSIADAPPDESDNARTSNGGTLTRAPLEEEHNADDDDEDICAEETAGGKSEGAGCNPTGMLKLRAESGPNEEL